VALLTLFLVAFYDDLAKIQAKTAGELRRGNTSVLIPALGGKPAIRRVHFILREVGEKGRGAEGAGGGLTTNDRLKPIA
jgi:hypothetical protein